MHHFDPIGLPHSDRFSFLPRFLSRIPFLSLLVVGLIGQAAAAPFAYVRLGDAGGKVAVVDVATNTVVREIPVNVTSGLEALTISPSGNQLYVANPFGHTISVVDVQSGAVSASFRPMAADGFPTGLAVNSSGNRLYVINTNGESLSVIDLATNLPLAQIPLVRPTRIGLSPTGNFAYVAQAQRDVSPATPRTVAVVDLQQNRVVREIPLDAVGTQDIVFSRDGSRAYFHEGIFIVVVDTATHTVAARWAMAGDFAQSMVKTIALSDDGSRLYVVADSSRRLHTVDTTTGVILSSFAYQNEPTSIVVDSPRQTAILFGERTGLATSVSLSNGAIGKSFAIGSGPRAFRSAVVSSLPSQAESSSSDGGGGCGYVSGSGGPVDPTLPVLAALALFALALRRRSLQR